MDYKNTVIFLNRPEEHFLESFYFKKIKSGIDEALENTEYQTLLSHQDAKLPEFISQKSCKLTGFINIAPHFTHHSIKLLERTDVPSVVINCRPEHLSWVDVDNFRGAAAMTEHLISMGHEKILFMAGFQESQNSIDRLRGFQKILGKHNLKFNSKLVANCDFSVTIAYERMKEILRHNSKLDFTAIFASNDLIAVGAIRALSDEHIRVPEDIAVVGYDDFDFASTFSVPLTTYRQPFRNLGFLSARMLLRQMEENIPRPQQAELIGEIIIRDSCGSKRRRG